MPLPRLDWSFLDRYRVAPIQRPPSETPLFDATVLATGVAPETLVYEDPNAYLPDLDDLAFPLMSEVPW